MQRPISVTVFGGLNIVFGGIGLLTSAVVAASLLSQGASLPISSLYRAYLIVSTGVFFVACAALLASGFGLLKLRPWARFVAMGYGVYWYLGYIVTRPVLLTGISQPTMEAVASSGGLVRVEMPGGALGAVAELIGMAHPLLLLVFMMLPSVGSAFHPVQPPRLPGAAQHLQSENDRQVASNSL